MHTRICVHIFFFRSSDSWQLETWHLPLFQVWHCAHFVHRKTEKLFSFSNPIHNAAVAQVATCAIRKSQCKWKWTLSRNIGVHHWWCWASPLGEWLAVLKFIYKLIKWGWLANPVYSLMPFEINCEKIKGRRLLSTTGNKKASCSEICKSPFQ